MFDIATEGVQVLIRALSDFWIGVFVRSEFVNPFDSFILF